MRLLRRRRMFLLATVALSVISAPCVSYAQFGKGLLGAAANAAKGKAAEALTDGVMKELEKKFTDMVAKEPISEAAKANIVKKLGEMARPIVKRLIDGAMSGSLPNPAELAQTVLKEVLPRVPELVTAAKKSEGVGAAVVQGPTAAQPVQEVAPAQPVQAAVPIQEATPAQPVQAAAPIQEVAPTQPVQAVVPIQEATPAQPVQAAVPIQEATPTQPVQAAAPIQEVAPAQPVQAVEEIVPVQPVLMKTTAQDAEPVQSVQTTPPVKNTEPQPLSDKPSIVAYVFGAKDSAINKAVATRLVISLAKSGHYQVFEDYMEFFDRTVAEQKSGAAPLNVGQIKELGERFGVDFICVTEVVTVFGEYRLFSYIMRVKTGKATTKGSSETSLRNLANVTAASEQIVESMFKKEQPIAAAAPPTARSYEPVAPCPPCRESVKEKATDGAAPTRKSKTGFTLGYGFSGDANLMQIGFAHVRAVTQNTVSLALEANFRLGEWNSHFDSYHEAIPYYGANIPVTLKFEKSVFFMEVGVFGDMLSVKDEQKDENVFVTNAGAALGAGLTFGKGYTQYYYRLNYGMTYYSHIIGIRQLF